MARKCLVIGISGTGKSTSISKLNPKETFIINVSNKSLPFKGWRASYVPFTKENQNGNYYATDNSLFIMKMMDYINANMPHIKTIIVDDYQQVMGNEYMRRAKDPKPFDVFKDIGQNAFFFEQKIDSLRDDLTVFVTMHPEVESDAFGVKSYKAKTVGSMIDRYMTIEGLYTVVLYTTIEKSGDKLEYSFVTQNTGNTSGKSPMGMFDSLKIPNDLELVRQKMIDYEV